MRYRLYVEVDLVDDPGVIDIFDRVDPDDDGSPTHFRTILADPSRWDACGATKIERAVT